MTLTQTANGHEIAWTLGELIRKAREDSELTQEELAEHVGVSRALVGHWEKDRGREPSYRQLRAIAEKTDFPLDILLSAFGYNSHLAGEPPFDLIQGTGGAIQRTLNLYPPVRPVHSP